MVVEQKYLFMSHCIRYLKPPFTGDIRYAFDSSNIQVWTAHNPIRYAMIIADGPAILWEFKGCLHLNDGLQGIDEIRSSTAWMYMATGDKAGIHTNL